MRRINLPSGVDEPFIRERTTFTGREYLLIFKFVRRYDYVTMSVYTAAGQSITLNVTLRTGADLLRKGRSIAACPPGSLFLFNSDDDFSTPTLEQIGSGNVKLYYLEPGEKLSAAL